MNSVNGSGFSAKPARLWQVAILTAAGAIGTANQAEAAFYYWTDYSDGSYGRQERHAEEPRQKPQKRGAVGKKDVVAEKENGAKPQGPLVIVVSIDRQKVTVYDANGVFAEAPVSTGMKGHSTPMGVFSIIQKHKFHHSNIYSGAPMPYMQRITWSGVAMHAGVLPGYPASHGCIRLPAEFATRVYGYTKLGTRVIVARNAVAPAEISHPLLFVSRKPPNLPLTQRSRPPKPPSRRSRPKRTRAPNPSAPRTRKLRPPKSKLRSPSPRNPSRSKPMRPTR